MIKHVRVHVCAGVLGSGDLVLTGEAAPPSCTINGYFMLNYERNFPTVLVLLGVIVEFQLLQPLSMRPTQFSCGLVVLSRRTFLHKTQVPAGLNGAQASQCWFAR